GRPGVMFQRLIDIFGVAFVKIAAGVCEVPLQKRLVHCLDQHVKAERPAIEADARMSYPRGWNAGITEEAGGKVFREKRRILARIIEHDLGNSEQLLMRNELVELHREDWLVLHCPETDAAL